jgi:NADH-quinone oxidoreductase subunit I
MFVLRRIYKVIALLVSWIGQLLSALLSLLKGLRVTFYYFSHPSTVVTKQYPENRESLIMFERFRSRLVMQHDEEGLHKCTACKICEQACPNGSIQVITRKNPALSKTELDAYLWRLDTCIFCNACVQVCPFSVLKMDGAFEQSVYDRRLLAYNLSRYAGPTSTALAKVSDPQEKKKLIEPRTPYYGPLPMGGTALAGLAAVEPQPTKTQTEPKHDYDPNI